MNTNIHLLDLSNARIAQTVLAIQHRAYRVEADLIGFEDIPPLHETIDDLQCSDEIFIGYPVNDVLAGVLSYSIENAILDIGRLVVHPDYFRRGIGKALVEFVETGTGVEKLTVSTGSLNTPARQLYEIMGYQLVAEVDLPEGVRIAAYEKCLSGNRA